MNYYKFNKCTLSANNKLIGCVFLYMVYVVLLIIIFQNQKPVSKILKCDV